MGSALFLCSSSFMFASPETLKGEFLMVCGYRHWLRSVAWAGANGYTPFLGFEQGHH